MNARLGMLLSVVVALGASSAHAAVLLDFNGWSGSSGPTQSGWDGYTLGGSGVYSEYTVAVTAIPTSVLQGRDRGANNPPNGGSFTLSDMYRDFLYVDSGNGVNIVISGLTANAQYSGRIWSYDYAQRATAASTFATDWSVNSVLVADNYSFAGWGLPTTDTIASFAFSTTANGAGQITIQGLRVTGNGVGINGLQLDLVPEPASAMLASLGGVCMLARRRRMAC